MKLLYFTAPWCVPCKTFGPIMDQVTKLPVYRVDVDHNPEMAATVNVFSVPTVVLVDGSQEVARFSGSKTLDYVNQFIADHS